ncbi:MAG: hypothetical protein NC912_04255 [Candidatus Omnitrophica bacterium]|nr:hypothetical protein [Candidatus Omnitrophota bacterium]
MRARKRNILISFLLVLIPLFLFASENKYIPELLIFYSESCHACHRVINEVMPDIEKEFFHKIRIRYLSIAEVDNYKLLVALREKYQCQKKGIPTVFIEGKILVGYEEIKQNLRDAIIKALKKKKTIKIINLPWVDLVERFQSWGVLTIVSAGLVDGINPCAFTVIVFFISFLSLQGYRRKKLLGIGLSFIFAVFLTYVLIGLGIFRFLYALKGFYWLTKFIYYLIAFLCFILAGFCLYDLWLFKKTKKTEAMTLQLPKIIKNKIHAIIGLHYRKTPPQKQISSQVNLIRLIISAFVVGFLVSLLEAVCTGQLYLPTLTFVLKEPSLRFKAFWYLILYNLMFVIPLVFVLLLGLLGTTSERFSYFMRKHMVVIKLLMALLFLIFGIIIIGEA